MLNISEISDWVSRVTYLPGWTFEVWEPDHLQGMTLSCRAEVEDSYNPGKTVKLAIHSQIPPIPDYEYLSTWFTWRMRQIAVHECMEFLQISEKPINDPHKDIP